MIESVIGNAPDLSVPIVCPTSRENIDYPLSGE
jgi:hypothetical protein